MFAKRCCRNPKKGKLRKKKAIKILELQRQRLLNPHYQNNPEWIFETASYIKRFSRINSAEYGWISQFKWCVNYLNFSKRLEFEYSFDELIRRMHNSSLLKNPKSGIILSKLIVLYWRKRLMTECWN